MLGQQIAIFTRARSHHIRLRTAGTQHEAKGSHEKEYHSMSLQDVLVADRYPGGCGGDDQANIVASQTR